MILSPSILAARPASGGPPYHAGAVHFDGASYLSIASLAAGANTDKIGVAWWYRAAGFNAGNNVFVVDPLTSYGPFCWLSSGINFDLSNADDTKYLTTADNISGGSANAWHSLVMAANTT